MCVIYSLLVLHNITIHSCFYTLLTLKIWEDHIYFTFNHLIKIIFRLSLSQLVHLCWTLKMRIFLNLLQIILFRCFYSGVQNVGVRIPSLLYLEGIYLPLSPLNRYRILLSLLNGIRTFLYLSSVRNISKIQVLVRRIQHVFLFVLVCFWSDRLNSLERQPSGG